MQALQLEPSRSGAPSIGLLTFEPLRAALEYASLRAREPRFDITGNDHPVVIYPGLGGGHRSIAPLTEFCRRLGYAAHPWGRGLNRGPEGDVNAWIESLARDVEQLAGQSGQSVSLIGWSLGGIYAREVAKLLAPRVRQVITIGTPFSGTPDQSHAGLAFRILSGRPAMLDQPLAARLATPPSAPTTSIYSKSDGIVAWQTCVQQGDWPHVENVEVRGSHCGLGWNREVLTAIAQRMELQARERRPGSAAPKPRRGSRVAGAGRQAAQHAHSI